MKSLFLSVLVLSFLGSGVCLGLDIDAKVSQSFGDSFVPLKNFPLKVVGRDAAKSSWTVFTNEEGEALFKDLKPGWYDYGTNDKQGYSLQVKEGGPRCVHLTAKASQRFGIDPLTKKRGVVIDYSYISIKAAQVECPAPVADGPAVGVEVTAKMGTKELKATTGKDGVAVIDGVEPTSVVFTASGQEKTLNLGKMLRKAGKVQVKVTLKGGVADLSITPVR